MMAQLNVKPRVKKELVRIKEEIAEERGIDPKDVSHSDVQDDLISYRPKSKRGLLR